MKNKKTKKPAGRRVIRSEWVYLRPTIIDIIITTANEYMHELNEENKARCRASNMSLGSALIDRRDGALELLTRLLEEFE